MNADIDLSKVDDQYCTTCKTKKEKYIGRILGIPAVLFKDACSCAKKHKVLKSDKERFDELQTPFWKMMGAKPKPRDIQLEKYLKHRGMSYGDFRRERDSLSAKYPSALNDFEKHVNKYGTKNAPEIK